MRSDTMNIVVVGNCQARPVATLLREMSHSISTVDSIIVHLSGDDTREADEVLLENADLILTQPVDDGYRAAHLTTSRLISQFSERVFTWPNIFFTGQCPDLVTLTRHDGAVVKGPLETYHSAAVLKAWLMGKTVNETVAYVRTELPWGEAELQDSIDVSMQTLREREQGLSVSISDFIESNLQRQRLFFTFNHPSLYVLIELCRRLCIQSGITLDKPVIGDYWEEPLGRITYPVTEPMANFLGTTFPVANSCKGVAFRVEDRKPVTGHPVIYSYSEFVSASFSAFDLQLERESVPRCTPRYLSELFVVRGEEMPADGMSTAGQSKDTDTDADADADADDINPDRYAA